MAWTEIKWGEEINEDRARGILWGGGFDDAVSSGEAHCVCRAAGWWDANDCARNAAYLCAARVARARGILWTPVEFPNHA